jgi:hypothetical protein
LTAPKCPVSVSVNCPNYKKCTESKCYPFRGLKSLADDN